ncbi:MAG: DUF3568 family protein [Deltaproteobacteria bacterium]|nr:DUF3568 family protein [Deltaproteobacteria bacterium]MBW1928392.1 DUF3568 family protein [Deltaproteobacteria bacterium]MBW2023809.1 DUF3568 family protein [Deltaproteobacteria bacterium]MBW2124578.1 DUF3568 family protein [Deltaproteobacteria bacterium]RLB19265.1 MAG: hypothetical protein DRG63_01165 [Deltaproteobacteria bacterium]
MFKAKLVVLGALSIIMTGCVYLGFFAAGTAAGIGGYKYQNGVLTVIYKAPYMDTWNACLSALEEMGLRIEKSAHDLTAGTIQARRVDNKAVSVKVEYKSARETKVAIRVGIFGDEDASNVIKENIRRALVRS